MFHMNTTVMVNFMCQLDWGAQNLVKHYYGCFSKSAFDEINI